MQMAALILFALGLQAPQEFTITDETLAAIIKDVKPLVEKAGGAAFKTEPKLMLSSAAEVRKVLARELEPQVRMQFPDAGEDGHKTQAAGLAEMLAGSLLGKYEPEGHRVHVVPDNFIKLARLYEQPRINSADYLRVVAIHELVHALDQERFKAMDRIADAKTLEQLIVWGAVLEGHAQHVTRAILASEKRGELFTEFEAFMTSTPPGLSEGEKVLSQMLTLNLQFSYIDGRKFFDALAAGERKTYVEDVFKTPPVDKDVFLHPETYYAPRKKAAARELKALWEEVGKEREGWVPQKIRMGEHELRASFGDFVDKDKVSVAVKALVGGEMLMLQPKDLSGSKLVGILIVQMETAAAAESFLGLFDELMRAKDARMKEGDIRIVKADYAPLKLKGDVKNSRARKLVAFHGQEVTVADVTAVVGEFVLEVLYSNEEVTDEALAKDLDRVIDFLKK